MPKHRDELSFPPALLGEHLFFEKTFLGDVSPGHRAAIVQGLAKKSLITFPPRLYAFGGEHL